MLHELGKEDVSSRGSSSSTVLVGSSLIRVVCLSVLPHPVHCFFSILFSDMTCSQRSTAHSLQSRGGFLSSLLSQSKKGPARPAQPSGASPTQTGSVLLGKKEPANHQVIVNLIHWKVLSNQGVNLQHSTAPSFCFHLEEGEGKKCSFLPTYAGRECSTRRAEGHV